METNNIWLKLLELAGSVYVLFALLFLLLIFVVVPIMTAKEEGWSNWKIAKRAGLILAGLILYSTDPTFFSGMLIGILGTYVYHQNAITEYREKRRDQSR